MKTTMKVLLAAVILAMPASVAVAAEKSCDKCCKGKCSECTKCADGKCSECCK